MIATNAGSRKHCRTRPSHYIAKGYTRAWCDPGKTDHEEPYVGLFDPRTAPPQRRQARRQRLRSTSSTNRRCTQSHPQTIRSAANSRWSTAWAALRATSARSDNQTSFETKPVLWARASARSCSGVRGFQPIQETPGFREHTRSSVAARLGPRVGGASTAPPHPRRGRSMARGSLGIVGGKNSMNGMERSIESKRFRRRLAAR